jgi:putative ABC transport system permease protein
VKRWLLRARLMVAEPTAIAVGSLRTHPARTVLAVAGIVIGIVTVVLVASVLANVRNQIALLFRELGTENIFAFHLSGDPYAEPSEAEARRKPLRVSDATALAQLGHSIREVAVQIIVPTTVSGQVIIARAGPNTSDSVLLEGASANFLDVVGAEFSAGRPFTELEDRDGARVAVLGASLARSLYGSEPAIGKRVTAGGETYMVVGELARRRGGFFGENRQDSVMTIPAGTARQRFGEPERVVLYVRAQPGSRREAYVETETILRRLRRLGPAEDDDFTLSTADQIIATLDQINAQVGLVTLALAGVSLFIGAIGIANVMLISVTERTREIGLRLAIGAGRRQVLLQFLLEAAFLSVLGGAAGVTLAMLLGLLIAAFVSGFSAVPPAWAILAGVAMSLLVGIGAGLWPARRAASLNPVDALRYE